jgi:hypothetical protein
MRDPHRGQKLRPAYVVSSPVSANASRGHCAYTVNALPDSFRQSAQWQRPTCTGSPSTV